MIMLTRLAIAGKGNTEHTCLGFPVILRIAGSCALWRLPGGSQTVHGSGYFLLMGRALVLPWVQGSIRARTMRMEEIRPASTWLLLVLRLPYRPHLTFLQKI